MALFYWQHLLWFPSRINHFGVVCEQCWTLQSLQCVHCMGLLMETDKVIVSLKSFFATVRDISHETQMNATESCSQSEIS